MIYLPRNIPVLDDALEHVWKHHTKVFHLPSCGYELYRTGDGTTPPGSSKMLWTSKIEFIVFM